VNKIEILEGLEKTSQRREKFQHTSHWVWSSGERFG
jgi:hypothetical protein